MKLFEKFSLGPASIIAAAFIGPGTVTVCTLAGVHHGLELLWALTFSVLATIILQEMSARVGIVAQMGLGESLRTHLKHPWLKYFSLVLVLSAILIGNAAYEAGNISGAILGFQNYFPEAESILALIIGMLAGVILYMGNIKTLEKILISMVIVMSFCFLMTAIATKPDAGDLLKGLFIPSVDWENILFVTGLVGTTVVPYNLFLHASLAKEKWNSSDIKKMRSETIISIILGGVVSMSIVIAAASLYGSSIINGADLGNSLEPVLGKFSGILIAIGLFSAGLTSAITAPLAAAYATKGIFGWTGGHKSFKFRITWASIIAIGMLFSCLGIKPIEIIKFAQITNGVLLPLMVIFLIYLINMKSLMGNYRNNSMQNTLAGIVLIICLILSIQTLWKILG